MLSLGTCHNRQDDGSVVIGSAAEGFEPCRMLFYSEVLRTEECVDTAQASPRESHTKRHVARFGSKQFPSKLMGVIVGGPHRDVRGARLHFPEQEDR